MSFLSILGDIAGLVPVPGAGILGDVLKGAGSAGSVLGAQQAGKAKGALDQAGAQQGQDRNAISLYQAQQQAQNQAAQTDLERQQFATTNRGQTAKQALIGALLGGGYQPTQIAPKSSIVSGGLARSLLNSPQTRAAMQTLNSQASTAQNTPLSFTGGNLVTPPSLTPLPQMGSGTLSDVANGLQLAGAVAPSFLKILQHLSQ